MSIYHPIKGVFPCYEVMGHRRFYLPMDKLPNELMGMNTQFIMQPDLVCGVPVMPVKATFTKNGSCTIELERGSYMVGQIINADYRITARVRVGSTEFAIGECGKAPDPGAKQPVHLLPGQHLVNSMQNTLAQRRKP